MPISQPEMYLGGKEDQMDLPFEDCKEVLIGDLAPLAKPGSAEAEKRWEWNSLDTLLEPRTQDGAQSLTKATQTEAGCADHEDQPSFHSRRDCDAIYMMDLAKSLEKVIHQGMKEFFAFLKIFVNIPIFFMLELVQFLGRSVFQVLLVGLITAIGDQMLEPLLAALFNSIIQPLLVFLLNVLCTIRNLTYPLIEILKGICSQVAVVLRAFRLVEINHHPKNAVAEHV
ncbi:uncharacterized protein LOC121931804 [Sceloporus undulatus]|uniref:uncharacterized protein LOC121931804 n=1 Tax=Sceloporus undulatus TaxID=8520 RepID=UPI001C4D7479|nr:uncharacterized protein LOC121931804 [Sceloporus undulatus]XP_042325771.1 uncharacterized protein LOC121931804 [Sceloporus undulatus]XP_042325772.1 uncharacterized protein LOC121931804 [Sceloporus undulatus]XP_042325773.1 uncharacterized protein LOC121931804 [Sceloporus undulatus]XP_042325774.1 uncharacterized protein LOC121931804 [Sceloporus undulatus]